MSVTGSTNELPVYRWIVRFMKENLSPDRQRHSFAVAHLARTLCERFGVEPGRGVLAGLGHDMAREMPGSRVIELAGRDGRPIGPLERQRPVLLHGRASAELLRGEGGLDDPEVLEAVRDHVTGRPGMSTLAGILYAADFLEPTRVFVDEEFRRQALSRGLDGMVLMVVERVLAYLEEEGRSIASPTEALRRCLEERIRSAEEEKR